MRFGEWLMLGMFAWVYGKFSIINGSTSIYYTTGYRKEKSYFFLAATSFVYNIIAELFS